MQSIEEGVLQGNIASLARMITYNESTHFEDNLIADKFIEKNQDKLLSSIVLSISGIPGVGKSSFIEAFGVYLHSLGFKIAVFSIDPSSELTQGSILGDKTRMTELSSLDRVFIRPSPSSNRLGGLGINSHKNIELAKIAGYDIILVETVGVGQSETIVKNLCDAFILLLMPASGDELQGIKKGIMEVADFFIVHKADGELEHVANKSKKEIENAVHMLKSDLDLVSRIFTFSSVLKLGMDKIWTSILNVMEEKKSDSSFYQNRIEQRKHWLKETYERMLLEHYLQVKKLDLTSLQLKLEKGDFIGLEEIKKSIES
jgi:LAO/AO transport system kinase